MNTSYQASLPAKKPGQDSMMNPFATQMQTTAATRQQQQTLQQTQPGAESASPMDGVPMREHDPLSDSLGGQMVQSRPAQNNAQTLFNRTDFSMQKSTMLQNQSLGGQNLEMSFQRNQNMTQHSLGQSQFQQ